MVGERSPKPLIRVRIAAHLQVNPSVVELVDTSALRADGQ